MPDATPQPTIKTLSSHRELLEEIDGLPRSAVDLAPEEWIFRGVGSSTYSLLPSALRPDTRLSYYGETRAVSAWSTKEAVFAEAATLQQYLRALQRTGLQVPGGGERCENILARVMRRGLPAMPPPVPGSEPEPRLRWPDPGLLPLLGIAQHHGVSTRLLDFTWDPRVACYFAAMSALDRQVEHFSVWAAHGAALRVEDELRKRIREGGAMTTDSEARMIQVDSAFNRRLHAQRGLFVLANSYTIEVHATGQVETWPPIEKLPVPAFRDGGLRRFDIPSSEAVPLLHHLASLGVDASAVYPDYEGAAKAVKERSRVAEDRRGSQ